MIIIRPVKKSDCLHQWPCKTIFANPHLVYNFVWMSVLISVSLCKKVHLYMQDKLLWQNCEKKVIIVRLSFWQVFKNVSILIKHVNLKTKTTYSSPKKRSNGNMRASDDDSLTVSRTLKSWIECLKSVWKAF